MNLPKRRKKPKSGIERSIRREWPRHRVFLRSHHCVVKGCPAEPIEVSHIRTAANAGTGIKPMDAFAVPMCASDPAIGYEGHHAEYHRIGHKDFEAKYKLDLKALAAMFTSKSTDTNMRDALRLVSAEELV